MTEADRVRTSYAREAQGLTVGERRAELVVGGAFVAAAGAFALLSDVNGSFNVLVAALYVLFVAVAGRVRIDVGAGFTVPVQIVFVPMLFALPTAFVPMLVAVALALGMAPDVVRGRMPFSRLLLAPGNSWFALGPALVLSLSGTDRPGANVAVLLLALAAQFAADFGSNAVRELVRGGISLPELEEEQRVVYLIDLCLAPVGFAVAFAAEGRAWAVVLVAPLFALLSVFSHERRIRLEQLIEMNDISRGTAQVLGDVVEADDAYTGMHCKDVVELSLQVAGHMRIDARHRRTVEFGALLHDVGKIAVPKEIINKPGKLDAAEWAIMKTHTIEGQRMLDQVGGSMREVGVIVRSSHERWDGDGYPDGLAGDDIPLESRIIAACDSYNAMTTTRSYRKAMPVSVAVEELRRCSGTQFDPHVVDSLLEVLAPEVAAASVAPEPEPEPELALSTS